MKHNWAHFTTTPLTWPVHQRNSNLTKLPKLFQTFFCELLSFFAIWVKSVVYGSKATPTNRNYANQVVIDICFYYFSPKASGWSLWRLFSLNKQYFFPNFLTLSELNELSTNHSEFFNELLSHRKNFRDLWNYFFLFRVIFEKECKILNLITHNLLKSCEPLVNLKNSKLAFGNKILYKTRNRFSKILIKRLKMKLTKIMNKNAVVLAIQFAKMAIQRYIVFSQTIGQRGN